MVCKRFRFSTPADEVCQISRTKKSVSLITSQCLHKQIYSHSFVIKEKTEKDKTSNAKIIICHTLPYISEFKK